MFQILLSCQIIFLLSIFILKKKIILKMKQTIKINSDKSNIDNGYKFGGIKNVKKNKLPLVK